MPAMLAETESIAVDLAREGIYRFLAALLSDPRHPRFALVRAEQPAWLYDAAALLRGSASEAMELGFSELPPERFHFHRIFTCLEVLNGDPTDEYHRVFGLISCRECPPFETEFQPNSEPFFRSQQMADIAGFYRAFGLSPSLGHTERPDHVCLELEFMAFLLMKKRAAATAGINPAARSEEGENQAAVCLEAAQKFFRDHLAWWLPSFARGLQRKAESGLYAAAGEVLAAFLPLERTRFGLEPQRCPVEPLPVVEPEDQASGCAGCAFHQA
jgi:TorA maturation chaperone TorD